MTPGFVMIRRGLEEHLVAGKISAFEAGIYLLIHLQSDFRTGVWTGSAARLQSTAPRGSTLRKIQRALNRLSQIGFIRVFHRHGVRGNYRVFIDKFEPSSGALKGMRLSAWKSECSRNPFYEPRAVLDAVSDVVNASAGAPYQEVDEDRKPFPSEAKSASDSASDRATAELRRSTKIIPSKAGLRLASILRDRIVGNNPLARIASRTITVWARDADLMMRRDGRTELQILELIEWSQRDLFWHTNILSMGKLREKFDQLTVKKDANGTGGHSRAEERDRRNLATAGFTS
jgi:hypothetical protein